MKRTLAWKWNFQREKNRDRILFHILQNEMESFQTFQSEKKMYFRERGKYFRVRKYFFANLMLLL